MIIIQLGVNCIRKFLPMCVLLISALFMIRSCLRSA